MFNAVIRNSRVNTFRPSLLEHAVVLPCTKRSISALANAKTQRTRPGDLRTTKRGSVQQYRTPIASPGSLQYSRRTYVAPPNSQLPPTSFPDPDRPDLFYHLFDPPTPLSQAVPAFALSFLPTKPSAADSCAVIGWLPAATVAGEDSGAGLNDFMENQNFVEVLHEAVHSALRDGVDEIQKNGAIQTQQGWMHIHDSRNIPALGRIGDPDDIIASVRVEDGRILADTYQPMPSYRLCTADGLLQLTEGLAQRLMEVLEARTKLETRSS